MINFLKGIFGNKHEKDVKKYSLVVGEINKFYDEYHTLTNDALRNKTLEFRSRIKEGLSTIDNDIAALKEKIEAEEDFRVKENYYNEIDNIRKERNKHLEVILKEILPEAFAVIKETARRFKENETLEVTATEHDREIAAFKNYVMIDGDKAIWKNSWEAAGNMITWDMLHYDVQLIGGMVLHDGKIAEMATGEGKTLVATLPAYLNGLSGEGVHVITVNDYLAKRDSEWVGPIFEFLFLTVDCIDKYQPHSEQRIKAYRCDITYGTNNEFGFDYLRDNMVRDVNELVQRKHHFAMVDEVDSVLIDDARTPLIISGPVPQGLEEQEYEELKPKIEKLYNIQRQQAAEFLADAKRLIKEGSTGHEEGEGGLALFRVYQALPKYRPLIKFLSEEGVKVILQKTENYYMQEQNRNMHLANAPLYFTIDEKNRNVELTDKGIEYLSRGENDPNFFILPDITQLIQDITDREQKEGVKLNNEKDALIQDYSIKSRRLHATSQLLKAYTLFEKDQEYVVINEEVKIVDEQTGRMMEGRRYSDGLHQALEAKEGVKVGEITQTYATITLQNYFRMYHKLAGMTGTAETEAGEFWEIYKLDVVVIPTNKPIIRDDREDLVYKTAREKYNTVIDEIVNLTSKGRPVLVGTTSVEISELLSRMLNLRGIKHNVLNAKQHQREAEIVAEAGKAGAVTIATNMAGRGTDIKISEEVRQAGGLAIIATERHDSRRVDRQLRGRSGRQGDPGSSQFYVSLEDNLMRLFQSERIAGLMDKMGHKEGEVIQHSMVTKSIERAQKKVEENNFGIRKRLLEYDDVMNIQREAIYKRRETALHGERLSVEIMNMFVGSVENIVANNKVGKQFDNFRNECLTSLGIDPEFDEEHFYNSSVNDLIDELSDKVITHYNNKSKQLVDVLLPTIKHVYETEGHRYLRIAIPFTDGRSTPLPIAANLKTAVDTNGASIMRDIEKTVTLAILDDHWKEHLRNMDELKDAVQTASFEQKDPLVKYKIEAYHLFEELFHKINRDVSAYLLNGKLMIQQELKEAKVQKTDLSKIRTSKEEEAIREAAEGVSRKSEKPETFKRTGEKIGRNDPCPCGSGKKYKHCHGNQVHA
ncbi:MAG: preprotein translocase subunit SecA [Saprospiraceae bacterium]|nr:MAG: protein translocase subunit secA [Bacteroidetes bacterium OLB9]MCO6463465.1 preprotein translocase subunit SecA [Saprospiraceae bacterium]